MRRGIIVFTVLFTAIAIAILVAFARLGAPVSATTSIDTDEITLGDTINYTFTVTAANGADVTVPDLDTIFEQFTVRDKWLVEKDGLFRTKTEYRYALTKYRPGAYRIPGIALSYALPGEGAKHHLRTQPFEIQVNGVLKEIRAPESPVKFSSDMAGGGRSRTSDSRVESSRKAGAPVRYPIKDLVEPKGLLTYQDMVSIAVAVVLAIVGVIVVIIVVRRLSLKKKAIRLLLPHELAFEQLRKLRRMQLCEKGETGSFCLELSSILKGYVQARLGVGPIAMTTKEFLSVVGKAKDLNDAQKKYVTDLITVCDLVKYAQYAPKPGELDAGLEREKKFVEETIPVVAEEKKA